MQTFQKVGELFLAAIRVVGQLKLGQKSAAVMQTSPYSMVLKKEYTPRYPLSAEKSQIPVQNIGSVIHIIQFLLLTPTNYSKKDIVVFTGLICFCCRCQVNITMEIWWFVLKRCQVVNLIVSLQKLSLRYSTIYNQGGREVWYTLVQKINQIFYLAIPDMTVYIVLQSIHIYTYYSIWLLQSIVTLYHYY